MRRMSDEILVGALRLQSEVCREFGSPFNGAMLAHMAADLEAGGPVGELLTPWKGASRRKVFDEAAPIRLVNAFTHLAAGDEVPELSRAYPRDGRPGDPDAAWTVGRALIASQHGRLTAFMGHEPQTNEVRRSGVLLGGFLRVAAETGLPLRCFELGASAGLNMLWDRFHYRLSQDDGGDAEWGDPAATVRVPIDWSGPAPPVDAKPQVVERAACDRRPTDLTDAAQRQRLLACIWPDQFDRLERSRAAIALVAELGLRVEAADALDWVRARVQPQSGAATVLYHSIFWQYLPAETREGLTAAIAEIGAQAPEAAPFAWLRMEPSPENLAVVELRLTCWPGGEDRLLGVVHPHGAWVRAS
jgi:hypothetical protein